MEGQCLHLHLHLHLHLPATARSCLPCVKLSHILNIRHVLSGQGATSHGHASQSWRQERVRRDNRNLLKSGFLAEKPTTATSCHVLRIGGSGATHSDVGAYVLRRSRASSASVWPALAVHHPCPPRPGCHFTCKAKGVTQLGVGNKPRPWSWQEQVGRKPSDAGTPDFRRGPNSLPWYV